MNGGGGVAVCLLCAVHDPDAATIPFIGRTAPTLRRIYSAMYVAVSDETAADVPRKLQHAGFATQVVPKAGAANARRDALRLASISTTAILSHPQFSLGNNRNIHLKGIGGLRSERNCVPQFFRGGPP